MRANELVNGIVEREEERLVSKDGSVERRKDRDIYLPIFCCQSACEKWLPCSNEAPVPTDLTFHFFLLGPRIIKVFYRCCPCSVCPFLPGFPIWAIPVCTCPEPGWEYPGDPVTEIPSCADWGALSVFHLGSKEKQASLGSWFLCFQSLR